MTARFEWSPGLLAVAPAVKGYTSSHPQLERSTPPVAPPNAETGMFVPKGMAPAGVRIVTRTGVKTRNNPCIGAIPPTVTIRSTQSPLARRRDASAASRGPCHGMFRSFDRGRTRRRRER